MTATTGDIDLLTTGPVDLEGSVVSTAGAVCISGSVTSACTGNAAAPGFARVSKLTSGVGAVVQAGTNVSIYGSGTLQTGDLQSGATGQVLVDSLGDVTLAALTKVNNLVVNSKGAVALNGVGHLDASNNVVPATGSVNVTGASITTSTSNSVLAAGNITLTSTTGGITVNEIGTNAKSLALDSTTGSVHLVGGAAIAIDGSVRADAGSITIGGGSTVTTATGTVLQTGILASNGTITHPNGAISVTSAGAATFHGDLLAGTAAPISVTTTGNTGDVTFDHAVAGYLVDPTNPTSDGQGVGTLTVAASRNVVLAGASTLGDIDVSGVSITTGGGRIRTIPAGATAGLGGNVELTATGSGGIRMNCVTANGACANVNYLIESDGEVNLQSATDIGFSGGSYIEARSNITIAATQTISVDAGGLTLYVANRSNRDADLTVPNSADSNTLSSAWNVNSAQPVSVRVIATNIQSNPLATYDPNPPDVNNVVVVPQIVNVNDPTNPNPSITVAADYPYKTIYGSPNDPNPLVMLQVNNEVTSPPVWRFQPFATEQCGQNLYYGKPAFGGDFGGNGSCLAGDTAAGVNEGNNFTLPSAGAGGLGSGNPNDGGLITVTGSLGATGQSGASSGIGSGGLVPGSSSEGSGISGSVTSSDGSLVSSATAEERRSELPEDEDAQRVSTADRCRKGAAGEADVGRSPGVTGSAPDVFSRCRELKSANR